MKEKIKMQQSNEQVEQKYFQSGYPILYNM